MYYWVHVFRRGSDHDSAWREEVRTGLYSFLIQRPVHIITSVMSSAMYMCFNDALITNCIHEKNDFGKSWGKFHDPPGEHEKQNDNCCWRALRAPARYSVKKPANTDTKHFATSTEAWRKYMEIHFIKTSNSYNRNNYGIATNVNILSNTNNRE